MIRGLRAAARLGLAVLTGVQGLALVLLRFGSYDATRRQMAIGWWARAVLLRFGVVLRVDGVPASGGVLLVANHVSWLDILAVHAVCPRARFVSKAAVKAWPLISRLADAANTLYLERERKRDALRVVHAVAAALQAGQAVAVFPEGTTGDGRTLLPFHANLLQAAIATATPVQPIAIRFSDAEARVSEAVEFVGTTTLLESLWRVARARGLVVHVSLLSPRPTAGADRRVLADALRTAIAQRVAADTGIAG
jgi:1-acyl-sn-glycerol-3-phosphate acyltransferase